MEQLLSQPSFTFTAPFNVEVIEVKGQEHVFLEGIISSTHIDLVRDIVTKNCLDSMKKQILEKCLKLDIEHEAFRGDSVEEKEINKTKVPAGKMFDADVKAIEKNHFGLFVKSELNPFNENYVNIKGNVQNGFLDAYSIAFIPTKVARQVVEGKEIRLLDDVALLNVALTGNPINTQATNNSIFLKSINSLEEYKNEKEINPEIMEKLEVKGGPGSGPRRGQGSGGKKPGSKKEKEEMIEDLHNEHDKLIEQGKESQAKKVLEKIKELDRLEIKGTTPSKPKKEKELEDEDDEEKEPKKKANHDHIRDKTIKLQEKNMTEDKETPEVPVESTETVAKEEVAEPKVEDVVKPAESAEVKAMTEDLKSMTEKNAVLEKEIADLKASIKAPIKKSVVDVKDQTENFEVKSNNPLDLI